MTTPRHDKISRAGLFFFFTVAVAVTGLSPLWATAALADKKPVMELAAYDANDARMQRQEFQADAQKRRERLEAQIRREKHHLELRQQAWEERADRRREALNRSIEVKEKRLEEKFKDQKRDEAWQQRSAA